MKANTIFGAAFLLLALAFVVSAQRPAEVVVTSTYLREAPDYNAKKFATLEKGAKVVIEKGREASGWTFVSFDGGALKGWILTATIKPVEVTEKIPAQLPPVKPSADPTPAVTPNEEIVENDNETLLIDTEEVSLNVRVLNSQNRPVGNTSNLIFRVFEDEVLQPVTSVSVAEVPIVDAVLIDNSRSLRTQLSKVIDAAKTIVRANKPVDETTVVRFVSADKIEVIQPFTQNRALIDNALDNLFVEGGQTAIIDAVYKTAEMVGQYKSSEKKDDVKLRAIILVTDGDDRGSKFNEKLLFELLRDSYVQIYAIGFTDDLSDAPEADGLSRKQKARAFLTRIAQETGGKVFFPESLTALGAIAAEIAGELRRQFIVSYSPTNTERDGAFRRIRVEVKNGPNGEPWNAITRTGRNAPKN